MNAYYEVLKILKTSLENNIDVNTVTQGNADDIDLEKKNIYPLAHIVIETGRFVQGVTDFEVDIYALDVVNHSNELTTDKFTGNDNTIDIDNTMLAVLRRTFDELVKDKYTTNITIVGDGQVVKVKNTKNDLIGWQISFNIQAPNIIISTC